MSERFCESCETRPASKWCNGCIAEDHEAAEIVRDWEMCDPCRGTGCQLCKDVGIVERADHNVPLTGAELAEKYGFKPHGRTIMVGGFAPGNETPNNHAVELATRGYTRTQAKRVAIQSGEPTTSMDGMVYGPSGDEMFMLPDSSDEDRVRKWLDDEGLNETSERGEQTVSTLVALLAEARAEEREACARFLEEANVTPGTPTQWAAHLRMMR